MVTFGMQSVYGSVRLVLNIDRCNNCGVEVGGR